MAKGALPVCVPNPILCPTYLTTKYQNFGRLPFLAASHGHVTHFRTRRHKAKLLGIPPPREIMGGIELECSTPSFLSCCIWLCADMKLSCFMMQTHGGKLEGKTQCTEDCRVSTKEPDP